MTRFSKGVKKRLRYYVYRLVDPRDGNTFYIGKGQGNRIFHQHAGRKIEPDVKGGRMPARQVLKELEKAGLEPLRIVHRSGMTDLQAKHVEAALVAAYPGVRNLKPKDGPKDARQLASEGAHSDG